MKRPALPILHSLWLAVLRAYVGVFWLVHGIPKFTQSDAFMPPNGMMMGFLSKATSAPGAYQQFVTNTVLPNAVLFGNLVRLGEMIAGALLLLGFFTRGGAIIGCFLALNYLAAKGGFSHPSLWTDLDGAAFVLSFANLVLPTGNTLGIDGLLSALRRPRVVAAPVEQPTFGRVEFVDEPPMSGPTAPPS